MFQVANNVGSCKIGRLTDVGSYLLYCKLHWTAKVLEYFSEGGVLIRYRSDSKEIRDGYALSLWPQPRPLTRLNCLDHSPRALHGQHTESLAGSLVRTGSQLTR